MQCEPVENTLFPPMVVVSVGNACNYACSHCFYPTYSLQPGYARHDMDFEVFRKIADEMGRHPESVLRLIAWGEPLLHPRLDEFVSYMRKAGPHNKVTLITNGSLLTPARSLALMKAGLDLVEVSIDAAHEATYRARRRTSLAEAFRTVVSNVQSMAALRREHKIETRIVVSFIVAPNQDSEQEFVEFREVWSRTVDDVVKRPQHTFKGTLSQHRPLPARRTPCQGLWTRCDITPWGEVSVCYNDWERANILGDLNDDDVSIESVWRGQVLRQMQVAQTEGRFCGICEHCKDYNPDADVAPYEMVIDRVFRTGANLQLGADPQSPGGQHP